jgi:hypothetical protein
MLFSIQRYLEDRFAQQSLNDADQYAVKLANLYDRERRTDQDADDFLRRMGRIRTGFFVANNLQRNRIEASLLDKLDRKFKKKVDQIDAFPGGLSAERKKLRSKPRSIGAILGEFKSGVEARAIDSFWNSRKKQKLQSHPEQIGQALLALFFRGVLNNVGLVLREVGSGVGFVDIVVLLSTVPHLIELKILRGAVTGPAQLQTYMKTEKRQRGFLVFFETRPVAKRSPIPSRLKVAEGTIDVLVVDLNPTAPSAH